MAGIAQKKISEGQRSAMKRRAGKKSRAANGSWQKELSKPKEGK